MCKPSLLQPLVNERQKCERKVTSSNSVLLEIMSFSFLDWGQLWRQVVSGRRNVTPLVNSGDVGLSSNQEIYIYFVNEKSI